MACGARVGVTIDSDRSRQASLSAAAPTPLIEKMRAAKLTGERKPVTALFVDVVWSTALLEQMDPEDRTEIINEAFGLMSSAVFRYEGTIAQLHGDAPCWPSSAHPWHTRTSLSERCWRPSI